MEPAARRERHAEKAMRDSRTGGAMARPWRSLSRVVRSARRGEAVGVNSAPAEPVAPATGQRPSRSSRLVAGLVWACVACPLIGWAVAWYWYVVAHTREASGTGLILLYAVIPGLLALGVNLALGWRWTAAAVTGMLAAAIGVASFVLYVVVAIWTHPGIFQ